MARPCFLFRVALGARVISALILDFDGLILDTETPLVEAWARVHADAGLTFDRRRGQDIIGHAGVAFDPWAAFPPHVGRAELEAAFIRHKDALIAQEQVLPGVSALLDYAASQQLVLGVASNSSHAHVDRHLARLGLAGRFTAVTCRDDVENPKPAPDVYRLVCARLGVEPGTAVAFEDSEPGHEAAARAGLRVVVVPNPSTAHGIFPQASLRLGSLAELPPAELLARFHP